MINQLSVFQLSTVECWVTVILLLLSVCDTTSHISWISPVSFFLSGQILINNHETSNYESDNILFPTLYGDVATPTLIINCILTLEDTPFTFGFSLNVSSASNSCVLTLLINCFSRVLILSLSEEISWSRFSI